MLVHEHVVDLAVRRCAGYVRPSTARLHPGSSRTTAGPQKLKSPATTAGRPFAGSCGATLRMCTTGPAYQSFDDVCSPTTSTGRRRRPSPCTRSRCARRHGRGTRRPSASSLPVTTGSRVQTASSHPPAGRTSPGPPRARLERREVRRAHRPALVRERVEQTRTVVESERLRHDDDVGVEPAHERGDVEPARAVGTGTGRLPNAR